MISSRLTTLRLAAACVALVLSPVGLAHADLITFMAGASSGSQGSEEYSFNATNSSHDSVTLNPSQEASVTLQTGSVYLPSNFTNEAFFNATETFSVDGMTQTPLAFSVNAGGSGTY